MPLGTHLTVAGLPGKPTLTVVGIAELGHRLRGRLGRAQPRSPGCAQPAISGKRADAVPLPQRRQRRRHPHATSPRSHASLPAGAIAGTQSYLAVKAQEVGNIAPFVPFLVAFGVIGIVMSVLIVANVVSGAVVAGYSRIGILKSIGFTPGQVAAAYMGQVSVPAAAGCLAGVVLGVVTAWRPLLAKTATAYGVGSLAACRSGSTSPCPRRHVRPRRARRAAARAPGGAAQRGRGGRGRARARGRSRLRRAPAARPAAASPAGVDRPRRPVRPAGTHRGDAGRGRCSARPRSRSAPD